MITPIAISRFRESPFSRIILQNLIAQGMLSATNFAVNLALIRYSTKTEYGIYVVCFSIIQMCIGFQNAISSTPVTVLLPGKNTDAQTRLISGNVLEQAAIIGGLIMLAAIYLCFVPGDSELGRHKVIVASMAAVIPVACGREFIKVLHYYYLNISEVLRMDGLFVALVLAGLALILYVGALSAVATLVTLSAAHLVSGLIGMHVLSGRLALDASHLKISLRETWRVSRWAIIGVAATNVQNYAYVFIVAAVLGLEFTADISAAKMVFMPYAMLVISNQRLLLAKLVHLIHEDRKQFIRASKIFITVFSLIWLFYFVVVMATKRQIIGHILGSSFSDIDLYLVFWGVYFLFSSVSFLLNHCLQALNDFRALAALNCISAVLLLLTCFLLTAWAGVTGSILSLILGELVFAGGALMRVIKLA